MESVSRVASAARLAGLAGIGLFALGPFAIQLGLASPFVGFRIFGLGLLAGLAALVLGLIGIATTRAASARAGRAHALTGLLLGIVVVACVAFAARPGIGVPAINDITTDPSDPPAFSDPGKSYPGAEFAEAQRAAYADLAPIPFEGPPDAAFAASLAAAQELGWEIASQDAEDGTFEATDTTVIFRFVDDVSVRVRPDAGASKVDLRSKSRDGKGDLGANAARIRAFRDALASG
ncbi:MAG: DUF1499 domain-containing protein [Myxococcales bacterium]|nr:MAG: DUF1499 domain-containing protein [Myxococcales bacterium]